MAVEGLESQQVKMRKADASIWSPIRILSSQPLTSIECVQFGTRLNLMGSDYSAFCPTGHLSCCSDIFAPPPLAKA
ncbi:hypothetical protein MHYP_G00127090 [Metynnis hypsauchen]